MKTIAFIGFGLIGGSIAKGLRKRDPELRIMAFSKNRSELELSQEEGILNLILDRPDAEPIADCDFVFLCAPVRDNVLLLEKLAPLLKEGAVLTDVGSTKTEICERAIALQLSHCFIGGHPMAGSEQSGYRASTDYLFSNAYYILCPISEDHPELGEKLSKLSSLLSAIPILSDFREHDRAVAAVSHLPHLIASSLVNLVRESDDEKKLMMRIAAGGFRDITRIASSSPSLWEQICESNAGPLSEVLDRYILSLSALSLHLKGERRELSLLSLFESSRSYRDALSSQNRGALSPDYSFSVDIEDEVGAISTISVILASKGISIKNIGINNARDHGEGALRISFYEEEAMEKALTVLERYRYDLRK